MATIKGKWAWNDYIEDKDENGDFQTHCEFVSNGQVFTNLGFGYSSRWDYYSLDYWGEDTGSMQVAASAQGDTTLRLELQEYRFMDFGEAGCKISMDAYDFIVANAEPVYSIAEKLHMIAENEQKVYDKGYQEGNDDGYDEGLEVGETKGYDKGKGDGLKEGYDNGYQEGLVSGEAYEKGKQAEYDAFWDEFQNGGNSMSYKACFGTGWTAENLKPKYNINAINCNYMFYGNTMGGDLVEHFERIGKRLIFDGAKGRNLNNTFDNSAFTRVGRIHATGASWYATFNSCSKLVTIDEAGNPAENGNTQFQSTTFAGCTALKNITIVGWIVNSTSFSSSTLLTKDSIESIVNHLSDTATGKTLTLSKTAVNAAFGDEWDSYVNAHKPSGWNITLA